MKSSDPRLPPQRVLIVDDDPMILKALRLILESDGHLVTIALGGEAGIAAFLESHSAGQPFTVVMTDLGMPGIDGRKVARAVKAAAPGTAVLLLTGCMQDPAANSEVASVIDAVLAKPPSRCELRDLLGRLAASQ